MFLILKTFLNKILLNSARTLATLIVR